MHCLAWLLKDPCALSVDTKFLKIKRGIEEAFTTCEKNICLKPPPPFNPFLQLAFQIEKLLCTLTAYLWDTALLFTTLQWLVCSKMQRAWQVCRWGSSFYGEGWRHLLQIWHSLKLQVVLEMGEKTSPLCATVCPPGRHLIGKGCSNSGWKE